MEGGFGSILEMHINSMLVQVVELYRGNIDPQAYKRLLSVLSTMIREQFIFNLPADMRAQTLGRWAGYDQEKYDAMLELFVYIADNKIKEYENKYRTIHPHPEDADRPSKTQ